VLSFIYLLLIANYGDDENNKSIIYFVFSQDLFVTGKIYQQVVVVMVMGIVQNVISVKRAS